MANQQEQFTLSTSTYGLQGEYLTPADKSISHRALIIGALAKGITEINHLLLADDITSTINDLRKLGIKIEQSGQKVLVHGQAGFIFNELSPKNRQLDCGNSGTTARLLLGLLTKQPFDTILTGDISLQHRSMQSTIELLSQFKASFKNSDNTVLTKKINFLPIRIKANNHLGGGCYQLAQPSAQLKSAAIFSALQADQPSLIVERAVTRNHTELMLQKFGAKLFVKDREITVFPQQGPLQAQHLIIPGDPSTAAFMVVAALLIPNSSVLIKGHSLNQTRTGLLQLLAAARIPIKVSPYKTDPMNGDLLVRGLTNYNYQGFLINQSNLGRLIDEIPIISLLATQLNGTTVINDAASLRNKETDRLRVIHEQLGLFGAKISETVDGLRIVGHTHLHKPEQPLNAYQDHRIAMMLVVAQLMVHSNQPIIGLESIAISNPEFLKDLAKLIQ